MYTKEQLSEQEKIILSLIKNKVKPKDVVKRVNFICSYQRVLRIIKENDVKQFKESHIKVVKENPFIGNEQSDYWVGFLAADGNISSKGYSVSLHIKDLDHIEKFRAFVNPKLNVYYRFNAAGSKMGTIIFHDHNTWNYLNSIGITPNKSRTIQLAIPLNWNIVRGIFDGDGSIAKREPKITTGSLQMLETLKRFFNENGLVYSVYKKKGASDIYIRGNSRRELFHKMYDNCSIKLDRKFDLYRAALEKFKVKNIG